MIWCCLIVFGQTRFGIFITNIRRKCYVFKFKVALVVEIFSYFYCLPCILFLMFLLFLCCLFILCCIFLPRIISLTILLFSAVILSCVPAVLLYLFLDVSFFSQLSVSRTCCLPCILFLSFLPYLINFTSSFFFCVFHLFLRVLCSESCIRFFNVSAIFTTSIWVSIANFFKLLLLLLGVTMTNVLDFLTKLNRQEEWWKNRISIHN